MELSVIQRKENPSLERTELLLQLSFEKAIPSRKEIRDGIIASVGCDPSCLLVVSVKSKFGSRVAKVRAHIYKSKEALAASERHHLLVRDGLAEKKKKEEAKK
ncbi:MAG: hypothetical protein N3G80_03270 [Candidatus Micrarchaeota archaeon]|nr:hypothetical protein [Candidatus Micrarchaeota archaeon]